jgi:hypothetical protein
MILPGGHLLLIGLLNSGQVFLILLRVFRLDLNTKSELNSILLEFEGVLDNDLYK